MMLMSIILLVMLLLSLPIEAPSSSVQKDVEIHCDPGIPSRISPVPKSGGRHDPSDGSRDCPEGEYLEWYWCSPCPDGTFRTRQMTVNDKYSRCQKCQTPDMYEIVAEPCTKTRDTKIMCEDGFFRFEVPGKPCQSICVLCDICGVGRNMFKNFVVRECSEYSNTVCCESEHMEYVGGNCVRVTKTTATSTTSSTPLTTPKFISIFQHSSPLRFAESDPRNSVSCISSNQWLCMYIVLTTAFYVALATVNSILKGHCRYVKSWLTENFKTVICFITDVLKVINKIEVLIDTEQMKSLHCSS